MIPSLTVINADAREAIKELPPGSIQSCITSPPYFGLRDYGTGTWEGGSEDCSHKPNQDPTSSISTSTITGGKRGTGAVGNQQRGFREECGHCGAKRIDRQIGLEETPQAYVETLVQIFADVHRVLRADGTLWLNLGDSYAGSGKGPPGEGAMQKSQLASSMAKNELRGLGRIPGGYKAKDLYGIPWLVALALRSWGWYLRSEIIWAKTTCMPESIDDRPTRSHEQIFLLSKRPRYYYDAEAIKEPASSPEWEERVNKASLDHKVTGRMAPGTSINGIRAREEKIQEFSGLRNKRDVWFVTPAQYPEAHFATFSPDLIKPCILAGSKIGDTILDPFGGSGTTAEVACELSRNAILIELNPDYIPLIDRRCRSLQPSFL